MVAVEDELIRIEYVGTKMMLADMLTAGHLKNRSSYKPINLGRDQRFSSEK